MNVKLRQTILKLIHLAGAAARRLFGAFFAGSAAFILLLLLAGFGVHALILPEGSAGWIQFSVGVVVVVGGTLIAALVGLLWPSPFLALGEIFGWFDVDIDF